MSTNGALLNNVEVAFFISNYDESFRYFNKITSSVCLGHDHELPTDGMHDAILIIISHNVKHLNSAVNSPAARNIHNVCMVMTSVRGNVDTSRRHA